MRLDLDEADAGDSVPCEPGKFVVYQLPEVAIEAEYVEGFVVG